MLAHVAGHCSPHSVDYVLMAYAFLYRILQVTDVVTYAILVELYHSAMSMENIKSPSSKNAKHFSFALWALTQPHESLVHSILFGRENDLFKSKFFFSNMWCKGINFFCWTHSEGRRKTWRESSIQKRKGKRQGGENFHREFWVSASYKCYAENYFALWFLRCNKFFSAFLFMSGRRQ